MRFRVAQRIADAVLYEGYVLYPYRASSMKNRVRWQFGIVAPGRPDAEGGEPSFAQTECLIESGAGARLYVRARFLTAERRLNERPDGHAPGVASEWLEAVAHSIDLEPIDLGRDPAGLEIPVAAGGIDARLAVQSVGIGRFVKVRLRLENLEPWSPAYADSRDRMLCRSLISAHLLLAIEGSAFLSLLDPPEDAADAVAACRNIHTWPVLVGGPPDRDLMLSSPIVLYDYPAVAPESPTDLCDGTEIDEILSLRIMTLTEEEKREARATDPRAAAIIDRTDALAPHEMARLHGTYRAEDFFNPSGHEAPETATVLIGGAAIARGSRVRLRPNRRADAMDMFLNGQPATVAGVYRDVDERTFVAVTVDADPAAELHDSFGRFFYFDPDEIDPIAGKESV